MSQLDSHERRRSGIEGPLWACVCEMICVGKLSGRKTLTVDSKKRHYKSADGRWLAWPLMKEQLRGHARPLLVEHNTSWLLLLFNKIVFNNLYRRAHYCPLYG